MKKNLILIGASILLVFLAGIILWSYSIKNDDKIYDNVSINDIHIGGLSKEEANSLLKSTYNKKTIKLIYNDQSFDLNFDKIGLDFKTEEAVDLAYEVGRNKNFIYNIKTMMDLKNNHQMTITLKMEYDDEKLEDSLTQIANQIDKEPQNAKISIANKSISITPETSGHIIDKEKLKETILNNIENNNYSDINVPVKEIHAQITKEYLSKVNTLLGEFSTRFNAGNYNRSYNVKLVAQKVNGVLVNPGEEFSFNDTTGKRGLSQGFKMAPIIVQGQLEEGVAGGVCQVSSTLYNAALYSGVTITDRRNHTIPSSYVTKGRDATLVFGSTDFKFKNYYQNPIYIENVVVSNNIISRIYGNASDKNNIGVTTDVTKKIPRQVEVKEDASLALGKERIDDKGRDGYKVDTYRIYYQNGKVAKKELISKSYYPPRKKVVYRGTKKVSQTDNIPNPKEGDSVPTNNTNTQIDQSTDKKVEQNTEEVDQNIEENLDNLMFE
ncbi:VanW family protein [Tepidibacter hydrothermalis]|uniref:VanW family protein n=1 Tax=Tepidibacter hydrothermalis TaxID=3036126 RepID=A0ABY8E9T1_9FIRM|nr:VanW family protein [Tepidibacter hydrothermalis]WFD09556.1 VanW family protein [Tepidibacter hydrothermalis]